jgi:threonyl-tRNA synthetase
VIPVAVPFVGHNKSVCACLLTFYAQNNYASEVTEHLSKLGLYADVDNSAETLKKKIRNGEIAQYNFILGALSTLIYNDGIACMFTKHIHFCY